MSTECIKSASGCFPSGFFSNLTKKSTVLYAVTFSRKSSSACGCPKIRSVTRHLKLTKINSTKSASIYSTPYSFRSC